MTKHASWSSQGTLVSNPEIAAHCRAPEHGARNPYLTFAFLSVNGHRKFFTRGCSAGHNCALPQNGRYRPTKKAPELERGYDGGELRRRGQRPFQRSWLTVPVRGEDANLA